jgi:hypothetical protein
MESSVHIGILFHSFVVFIVACVAAAFSVFLFRRWRRLDEAMRAYGWFWVFTFFVWSGIALRYFMIGVGKWDISINANEIFIQSAVFFTGPPLFYYAGLRVFKNQFVAGVLGTLSLVLGFNALVFLMQPGGLLRLEITDFSADTLLNPMSQIIFSSQIVVLVLLYIYDIGARLLLWYRGGDSSSFYNSFHSLVLILYVVLGGIDNSHIIMDWPLVVFRLLYAAAFLFGYIVINKEDAAKEKYLVCEIEIPPQATTPPATSTVI